LDRVFSIALLIDFLFIGCSQPGEWDLSYQIIYLPGESTMVAEGEAVVIFDTKQVEPQMEESTRQLESHEQELPGKELSNRLTIQEIKNNIHNLEIQEEINLNRPEQAKYNSDIEQKDALLELGKPAKMSSALKRLFRRSMF